jgi:hypothetical protein
VVYGAARLGDLRYLGAANQRRPAPLARERGVPERLVPARRGGSELNASRWAHLEKPFIPDWRSVEADVALSRCSLGSPQLNVSRYAS